MRAELVSTMSPGGERSMLGGVSRLRLGNRLSRRAPITSRRSSAHSGGGRGFRGEVRERPGASGGGRFREGVGSVCTGSTCAVGLLGPDDSTGLIRTVRSFSLISNAASPPDQRKRNSSLAMPTSSQRQLI